MDSDQTKIKIVFCGSDDISVPIFVDLLKYTTVLALITTPDKPAGRGNKIVFAKVKQIAIENNIPILQPEKLKDEAFVGELEKINPELIIVAAYGKILPAAMLQLPKYGVINFHPSLLPKYRGSSPIQSALLNGDAVSGVSIIQMNEKMDSGNIIIQKEFEITKEDDYFSIADRSAMIGLGLIRETIDKFRMNKVSSIEQVENQATYCQKIDKTAGKINWNQSSTEIFNQVRAYCDWPICYTIYDKKKFEIIKSQNSELDPEIGIGQVFKDGKKVYVRCGQNCLEILKVKMEGKKELMINDFLNGQPKFIGATLE